MLFKTVFKKGDKYLAKIIFDDVGEKWASTTKAVFDFAKKSFKEDEKVDVEYTVKNGQYSVSKIKKPGTGGGSKKTEAKEEKKNTTAEYKCEECGAKLKDDKYKKCYTCNQKNPEKTSVSKSTGESIKDQVTLKVVVEALKILTGQVSDPDTIFAMIETGYKRLRKLLK